MTDTLLAIDEGEHPALVTIRAADTGLMARLKERSDALDEEFLTEHEPFFWRAEISSNRLDSHSTRMDRTSLKNYAADAEAGVPFMNSHRTGGLFKGSAELPLGRSLEGKFNAGQRSGDPSVHATFYTMRGLRLNEVSTDDFIDGVRSGIIKDVSIGFSGGYLRCDLCNEDMMRSETCTHFPGMTYEVERKEGEKKHVEKVVATASVMDARLAEVSAVFKGSTPGAVIIKAQRMAEAHLLAPQALLLLEDQYRIMLPGSPRSFTMGSGNNTYSTGTNATTTGVVAKVEEKKMGETSAEDRNAAAMTALQTQLDKIRAALGLDSGADLLATVAQSRERLQAAEAEVERLKPMAVDGEAYRNDLITQTVTEGKRAFGEAFNEEQQKSLLKLAPIETLKATRDAYAGVADKLFPKERVTTDNDGDGEEKPQRRAARRRSYAGV